MEPTLRIKITMIYGTLIQVEEELEAAQSLLDAVPHHGYVDPRNARFYPASAIRTIEVMSPPAPIEFCVN